MVVGDPVSHAHWVAFFMKEPLSSHVIRCGPWLERSALAWGCGCFFARADAPATKQKVHRRGDTGCYHRCGRCRAWTTRPPLRWPRLDGEPTAVGLGVEHCDDVDRARPPAAPKVAVAATAREIPLGRSGGSGLFPWRPWPWLGAPMSPPEPSPTQADPATTPTFADVTALTGPHRPPRSASAWTRQQHDVRVAAPLARLAQIPNPELAAATLPEVVLRQVLVPDFDLPAPGAFTGLVHDLLRLYPVRHRDSGWLLIAVSNPRWAATPPPGTVLSAAEAVHWRALMRRIHLADATQTALSYPTLAALIAAFVERMHPDFTRVDSEALLDRLFAFWTAAEPETAH